MNHKQKLGYMALGAGILAIGIIIGQVVTPDIEAQSNGVFDKITCREIEVIDKDGNEAIRLYTTKHGGDIRMHSKDGRIAAMGISEDGGSVYLSGKGKSLDGGKVSIFTHEDSASLDVGDESDGGISMFAISRVDATHRGYASIAVKNQNGSAYMTAGHSDTAVEVYRKDSGGANMRTDEHGGRISVFTPDVAAGYIWSAP